MKPWGTTWVPAERAEAGFTCPARVARLAFGEIISGAVNEVLRAAQNKDTARTTFETALRALTQRPQPSLTVTDAQRPGVATSIRSKTHTAAGVPTARPVAMVDTRQRLAHVISFTDEARLAKMEKPCGVMGEEISVKVGDASRADASELVFLGLDTNSPYLARYAGVQAGKKAHYMLQWVSTRCEKRPWSDNRECDDWRLT